MVDEVVGEGGELVEVSRAAATEDERPAGAGRCVPRAGLLNRVRAELFASPAGRDDGDGKAATWQVERDRGFRGEAAVAEADEGQEAPPRGRDPVGKSNALRVPSGDRAPLALTGGIGQEHDGQARRGGVAHGDDGR